MRVRALADLLGVTEPGVWLLAAVTVLLGGATLARGLARWRRRDERTRDAWRSLGTWWALFGLFVVLLMAGPTGVLLAAGLLSALLLRETLRLIERPDLVIPLALAAMALYVWAWVDWTTVLTRVLPAAAALLVGWELTGRPRRSRGDGPLGRRLPLAVLLSVLGPAYAFGVAAMPPAGEGARMRWFVLLMVLTELNDMAQAWWGRAFGSRPLAPRLSPGKTWRGLAGGVATTCLVSSVLGPVLTGRGLIRAPGPPLDVPTWAWGAGLGVAIALAGILGDLAASALKRSAGAKDSGTLLPGQGGLLDRFDSLAATAPVLFVLMHLVGPRGP